MAQAGAWAEPATKLAAVTPSDSTDLTMARGIHVSGAGNLAVRMVGDPDTTVTLAVVAGELLPIRVTRVMAATTATGITAFF